MNKDNLNVAEKTNENTYVFNTEKYPYTVKITNGNNNISLTQSDVDYLFRYFETEIYYKEDIIIYVESKEKYSRDLLNDKKLFDELLQQYSDMRFENDGSDADCTLSWIDCLDCVFEDNEPQLQKYKL